MTAGPVRFSGFRPAAFAFFRELRDNNDPAWFKPRKGIYEAEVLAPFRQLIGVVGAALAEAGLPLIGDPARGIFRIYRDVRFSPDKRLYKTHAGAVLTRSGGRRDPGLLYLHVAPDDSMVAAGFWHPDPALLTRLLERRRLEFVNRERDLPTDGARPVLDDAAFRDLLRTLDGVLNPTALA